MDRKTRELMRSMQAKNRRKNEWYNLRPILGYANWAELFFLLGARETGKSYAVTNFFVDQFVNRGIPFVWLRLTDKQAQKLLQNNAEKLVDPDIRRKYNLELKTNGTNVYHVEYEDRVIRHRDGTEDIKRVEVKRTLMARVLNLSTFYTDKGSIFDKDFLKDLAMRYNIACDEFEREKNEKNTFDILYALTNQLENLVRSTKERIKVFFMGNTLEECSDILSGIGFIPEEFGLYKLKSKRAVIHYIPPSEEYLQRRKGTLADILMPTASTFTNAVEIDKSLITKQRLVKPQFIIKFSKDKGSWFTVWNNNIVSMFNGEKGKPVIPMRPYLDEQYNVNTVANVMGLFDTRSFQFRNLITFKRFQNELALLKPRGN